MPFFVSHHPLIEDKITRLRSITTDSRQFRSLITEITTLTAYEATKNLPLTTKIVDTPVQTSVSAPVLDLGKIAFVPVLRAGLGMVDGCLSLLPQASVWHLGMRRNEESLQPEVYYNNLQQENAAHIDQVFIIDPMLATGGSSVAAIKALRDVGVAGKISLMCIIAAPEGVAKVNEIYPDIDIFAAALDEKLNDKGYIMPGLGDAGDRLFGT